MRRIISKYLKTIVIFFILITLINLLIYPLENYSSKLEIHFEPKPSTFRPLSKKSSLLSRIPQATQEFSSTLPKNSKPTKFSTKRLNFRSYDEILIKYSKIENTEWLSERLQNQRKYWEIERQIFYHQLQNRCTKFTDDRQQSDKAKYLNHFCRKIVENRHNERELIIFYLGLLDPKNNMKIAESIKQGGPVGELVQWTDIILTIFTLGYPIRIFTESVSLVNYYKNELKKSIENKALTVKAIFTDISGHNQLKYTPLNKFKCLFHLSDSFGTEQKFNHPTFYKKFGDKNQKNDWGKLGLDLGQFGTLYPHTPDNSFYGFAMTSDPERDSKNFQQNRATSDRPKLLVYGKYADFWIAARQLLDHFNSYFEIQATLAENTENKDSLKIKDFMPDYVINHGVLKPDQYLKLMRSCQVFIGLGFPYDGPAAMEAIANGLIFIQPYLFDPEVSKGLSPGINRYTKQGEVENGGSYLNFFNGKPTERRVFSQHDYLWKNVGEPFVYTLDYKNETSITKSIDRILNQLTNLDYHKMPKISREFTISGMLERFFILLETQDFCHSDIDNQPEISKLYFKLASQNLKIEISSSDCNTACSNHKNDFSCSNSFIRNFLNIPLENMPPACQKEIVQEDQHQANLFLIQFDSPILKTKENRCALDMPLLQEYSSCSHYSGSSDYKRICPCVKKNLEQSSLCYNCALLD